MPNFEQMRKSIRFGEIVDGAAEVPAPFINRAEQARRFAQLKEASEIVAELPGPGQSLHAIMTGRYDLADTVAAILKKLGKCKLLRIATLAFSDRNAGAMRDWLRDGMVKEIRVLTSLFHRDHEREFFKAVTELLAEYSSRISASRSHCKVVTLDFGRAKYVIEGSANLRTNSN